VTNEKFVIAMLVGGGILVYWGKFRRNVDRDDKTKW
jgi:hypothetical protein